MVTQRALSMSFAGVLILAVGFCSLFTPQLPLSGQTPFSSDQAKEAARSLVSEEIDIVVMHASPVEAANYLAFSTFNPRETGLAENIWLYREYGGVYERIWHKEIDKGTKFDFVLAPSQSESGLAVNEPQQCGSDACSRELILFALDQRKEYSIFFHDEGAGFYEEDDHTAQDQEIKAWLQSWARKLGIYPQTVPASQLDNPENIEDAWRNDNGYKVNGILRLRYYKSLPPSYLSAVKSVSANPTNPFITHVDDGRYAWSAYFKAGVVGYSKRKHGNTLWSIFPGTVLIGSKNSPLRDLGCT